VTRIVAPLASIMAWDMGAAFLERNCGLGGCDDAKLG
jgi:hypothetical protein